ncbi:MAG TPA: hypothetical protein VFQ82_10210 [Stellaceae bacterium]|jgi:hypothetical protein|nr:hypothetical protein [Stellaceae bacterium]
MDLRQVVAVAKQQVADLCAPDIPQNLRLENYLYDDHLGVWSLTIGFALPVAKQGILGSPPVRNYKVVRVSEADKSVLSVIDH